MADYSQNIGKVYGTFKVVEFVDTKLYPCGVKTPVYLCECTKCGATRNATLTALRNGIVCQCSRVRYKSIRDYTGQSFGALTVVERDGDYAGAKTRWIVKCALCGNTKSIDSQHLTQNRNNHCGCLTHKHLDMGRDYIKSTCIDGTNIVAISRKRVNRNSTTGIRGVNTFIDSKGRKRYRAIIMFKRKQYHLGLYDTIEEAAEARQAAEKEIYGKFLEWYEATYGTKRK